MVLATLLSGKLFSLLKKTENATNENIYVTVAVVAAIVVVVVIGPKLKLLTFNFLLILIILFIRKNINNFILLFSFI